MNDRVDLPSYTSEQLNKEILLELRLHGFSDYKKGTDWRSDELADKESSLDGSTSTYGGSIKMNGSTDYLNPYLTPTNYLQSYWTRESWEYLFYEQCHAMLGAYSEAG
ncbi:hypothetical protein ACFX15_014140 [Malus domestica]